MVSYEIMDESKHYVLKNAELPVMFLLRNPEEGVFNHRDYIDIKAYLVKQSWQLD